jgi:hypothetical protein
VTWAILGPVIDGGYFAKRVMACPAQLQAPTVREVCSVSDCMSSGPDGWVEHWKHNELGWFNTIADAMSVVPAAERSLYRLFAYRLEPFVYHHGTKVDLSIPADVHPEPIGPPFVERGFDAVSTSSPSVLGPECSPLSCNDLAAEIPTNEFCLFPTGAAAQSGAQAFSIQQPEPGDYYVVQVLEWVGPERPW